MKYVNLLRMKHWVKNFLCFLPLFFSVQFLNVVKVKNALLAFAAFCLSSSIVYIFNDMQDRDADRKNSYKCKRPIASGTVPVKNAICIMLILGIGMTAINFCILSDKKSQGIMFAYLIGYILLNFCYSLWLKHIPIIDVIVLASGFIIRVFYGGLCIGSGISNWVYLTVLAMAFFFSFGKRRNEMKVGGRSVLEKYPVEFLNHCIYMSLTLVIVFYCLCVTDNTITMVEKGIDLRWTIIIVIYLCLQYVLCLETSENGDPVELFSHNKLLVVISCILLIGIVGQAVLVIF